MVAPARKSAGSSNDGKKPKRKKGMRKVPLQERSRERLARIVDAGQGEFAETGYEGATMEAIAERAGTSIGSLYQFFPHKRALFDAVAERYERQAAAFFTELIATARPDMTMSDMVDRYVDAFWKFTQSSDGIRAVWLNGLLSHALLDMSDEMNRQSSAMIAELLRVHVKGLSKTRRETIAMVIVDLGGCMLFVAARKKPPLGDQVIDETKIVLKSYLTTVLG